MDRKYMLDEIQKSIITKIHGLGLKKAKEKEFNLKGCIVIAYKNRFCEEFLYINSQMMDGDCIIFHPYIHELYSRYEEKQIEFSEVRPNQIIGLPANLNRVMYTLEKYDLENANNELQFSYLKGNIIYTEYCNDGQGFDNSIPRKLVNDDGTDATLMDQNDATIVKLYNLLCN